MTIVPDACPDCGGELDAVHDRLLPQEQATEFCVQCFCSRHIKATH